jgi:hypothetical protein
LSSWIDKGLNWIFINFCIYVKHVYVPEYLGNVLLSEF